jgi:hypothetical protein
MRCSRATRVVLERRWAQNSLLGCSLRRRKRKVVAEAEGIESRGRIRITRWRRVQVGVGQRQSGPLQREETSWEAPLSSYRHRPRSQRSGYKGHSNTLPDPCVSQPIFPVRQPFPSVALGRAGIGWGPHGMLGSLFAIEQSRESGALQNGDVHYSRSLPPTGANRAVGVHGYHMSKSAHSVAGVALVKASPEPSEPACGYDSPSSLTTSGRTHGGS